MKQKLKQKSISIPYGSIKRLSVSSPNTRRYISIPYGSIKSAKIANIEAVSSIFQFLMVRLKVSVILSFRILLIFQFLMVRLKARTKFMMKLFIYISIPYGSIKSKCKFGNRADMAYFNSLWFD